jgi:hypothetical protein
LYCKKYGKRKMHIRKPESENIWRKVAHKSAVKSQTCPLIGGKMS